MTPAPLDRAAFEERLRLTGVSAGLALLGIPVALALAILSILAIPLALSLTGFVIALAVVPATEQLTGLHRRVSGALLAEEITAGYADTSRVTPLLRPLQLAARPGSVARRRVLLVLGHGWLRARRAAGRRC